jgi:IQ and AAA domain-containing protein
MLYGAAGTGKTMMVEAVAHELGALLLNLSPGNLKGLFPGKNGPTKLIHMAFTVARHVTVYYSVMHAVLCSIM